MPTLPDVHMRGTRALQPLASTVSVGALYYVTNEGRTERSNGAAWEAYTDTAASTVELEARVTALEAAVAELRARG